MKFRFNYNDSTLWVGTSRYLRSPKEEPTYASTILFIQHVAKYIQEIGKKKS